MSDIQPKCLVCNQTDQQVPLITLLYQSKALYICARHLPTLIHQPEKLVGILPGAEKLQATDHEH